MKPVSRRECIMTCRWIVFFCLFWGVTVSAVGVEAQEECKGTREAWGGYLALFSDGVCSGEARKRTRKPVEGLLQA